MKEIHFGKRYYHLHNDIITWCREHLGPGGWGSGLQIIDWEESKKWEISCTFGNSKIIFKDDEDATLFKLGWNLCDT